MDLNIRDFPDDLHKALKSEAALSGITLRHLIISFLVDAKASRDQEMQDDDARKLEDDNCYREKLSSL